MRAHPARRLIFIASIAAVLICAAIVAASARPVSAPMPRPKPVPITGR